MAILELKDVTKKFGGLTAVDGVNLKVEENQIIKNAIPINLMVFLLLSHVIYIGIRCYGKAGWKNGDIFKI